MVIPDDFYRISHSFIGNESYFKTKPAAEQWLKDNGYVLADKKIWAHVYKKVVPDPLDESEGHTFLSGEVFEETFDKHRTLTVDSGIRWFYNKILGWYI